MKITFTNQYFNDFRLLSRDEQETVIAALDLLQDDPFHDSLRNHVLEGRLKGRRSIVVDNDLRIVFRAHRDHAEITLLSVGPHERVYRR